MGAYYDALSLAMEWLGQQERTIFFGQGVGNAGTQLSKSFDGVPAEKRIEFPVAEEMQIGLCVGASLNGFIPISIIPRWDFALRAADAIVHSLDRLPLYSDGGYRPRVIIRTAVPSIRPFNPGTQHDGDFSEAFRLMLRTVRIIELEDATEILPAYQTALELNGSTILVEYAAKY